MLFTSKKIYGMEVETVFITSIALFLVLLCDHANTARSTFCPRIYQRVFKGYVPSANITAGVYTEVPNVKGEKSCVFECCIKEDCNVAFMTDEKCYHIKCLSNEMCLPTFLNDDSIEQISMVLVKPVESDMSWSDVIKHKALVVPMENMNPKLYGNLYSRSDKLENDYKNYLHMEESTYSYSDGCEVGVPSSCGANEECIQNFDKGRAGTCKCKFGYTRISFEGECVPSEEDAAMVDGNTERTSVRIQNSSEPFERVRLTVSAESKEVRLPESEVSLTATVHTSSMTDKNDIQYQYEWTALTQPEGSGAVKHQNGETLQLSKLSEGLYTFKVAASNEEAYGETFVNVTVLPPSRTNQPPQIVITPANQIIKLPNTGAVLDASSSTDDDGIVSYHWELQQGPLGYQPQLHDMPTLLLNDLSIPGNYTFKLTVTDTDKAISSSTANITVLKITDYPPEANAGQDTIIYLPHNKITLNGNQSIDDHMITTWEWTKSPDDAEKAVDMQDTRTPYLRLSDLEEGMYTFTLKVTDSANQSSTAQVHVFVKPPTNKPPVADAGPNVTISLPQTWVQVDGSNSTDDNKIDAYRWEQINGPSTVTFADANSTKTNVTGLTKGEYVFKLTVADDNGNVANSTVRITVDQNKNQRPTANGGGDQTLELPRNAIYLNGSKSSDDWAIVRWRWSRHDTSLAMGAIAEGSDETSVLILTDLRSGRYVFNLTVFDEQGLSDTVTVTVTVKDDPKLPYLVDMIVGAVYAQQLTEAQYSTLKGKLALLMQDDTKLQIRTIREQPGTGLPVITFYGESTDGNPLEANELVRQLRRKLKIDAGLLGFSIERLQTTICQNNCSGHGVCEERTRKCICEAFWMEDLFKLYFVDKNEDSDCSWSVLYVALGTLCIALAVIGSVWGSIYLCMNGCTKGTQKLSTYKLIEDADDLPNGCRKADVSDSDTDSDVVFESRNKSGRFNGDGRTGHKSIRNGFSKIGRRVKTKRRSLMFARS